MSEATRPSISLLCKLASVVVHADELHGPNGHPADEAALRSALNDPDVKAWIDQMTALALAPVKRSPQ